MSYAKILVPLDGSELSERALVPAAELAAAGGGELVLFRSSELLEYPGLSLDDHRRIYADLQSYLEAWTERLEVPACHRVAEEDDPALAIVEAVEDEQAQLIVISSHGRSGIGRWVHGSVAEKVLSQARCPVLIVRGDAALTCPSRRVLVPLDGSPLAEKGLSHAKQIAGSGTELLLLQVVFPIHEHYIPEGLDPAPVQELQVRRARAYLTRIQATLTDEGFTSRVWLREGHPAADILAAAREFETDLTVISSHGYGGLRRWVYGSVADKVLRGGIGHLLLIRYHRQTAES